MCAWSIGHPHNLIQLYLVSCENTYNKFEERNPRKEIIPSKSSMKKWMLMLVSNRMCG